MTGLAPVGVEKGTGLAVARWNQRIFATDLDYRLMVSTNLMGNWDPAPSDLVRVKTGLTSGMMEEIETKYPFPSSPLFIRLEVQRR